MPDNEGMDTQTTHRRFTVRRTLLVRPDDYGTLAGTDYGSYDDLDDAIRAAKARSNFGYPSRVVDTHLHRCVWLRP